MTTPLTVPYPTETSLGVKTSDQFLIQTYNSYQSLIGTSFIGVYKGNWPITIGQSANQITTDYAVIAFRFDPHNISLTLSSMIMQDTTQQIWKAITGPNESDPHTDYWLWAKNPIKGAVKLQRQTYTIIGVSCLSDTIIQQHKMYRSGIELNIEAGALLTDKKI